MDTEKLKQILTPHTFLIGVLPAILGASTIFACYYTTVYSHQHLPPWLWMPVISLLGCAEPESTYYQIGFALTGLSTLLFYFTFQTSILRYIPAEQFKDERVKLQWSVLLAAFGVFGQGVITMEESAIDGITKPGQQAADDTNVQWQPGRQSMIHQLLAAVFFMACMFHGFNAITVYKNCAQQPFKSMVWSRYFKMLMFGFPVFFQFFAFMYHPIRTGTKTQNELNKAGLAQWITVFCYLAFYASYAVDHLSIQAIMKGETGKDSKKAK
eukprot:CAMPEP_0197035730 /NCGR_PEP_ID=MMETSP1384-20130603/13444_1 /TAXON_ID=29189 /ORGANISM="Ammonia sp." /LENGTH=268 /DNA_ID=CAMNT_0042465825 /DNA_START=30 /DNA_END=836 /DNA_ORIENTATION=+